MPTETILSIFGTFGKVLLTHHTRAAISPFQDLVTMRLCDRNQIEWKPKHCICDMCWVKDEASMCKRMQHLEPKVHVQNEVDTCR